MVTIFLDFDGTVVKGPYPDMSQAVPGAIEFLKEASKKGYKIILNTYRANINEKSLQEAIGYLNSKNITIEKHLFEKKMPYPYVMIKHKTAIQHGFPIEIYIDDIAHKMPLISDGNVEYVDFKKVKEDFVKYGLF